MPVKPVGQIELIPHADLIPSTYNPRQADPGRLELVALSLRKFGWLLPADAQFWTRQLRLAGQALLEMAPNPDDSIPVIDYVLVR